MKTTTWLRVEGLAALTAALVAYHAAALNWWWLAVGILLPDVSVVGYLVNNKAGAWIYNLGHALILPTIVIGLGYRQAPRGILAIGLIWAAHIGMDRLLGFGLKEPKGFKYTHLGKIGG